MNLEEAMASGFAGEVPINCANPEHEDRRASATCNTIKGLWYCHGCHAWGDAKGVKYTPTDEQLLAMLEPERACRAVHPRLLEFYAEPTYWAQRFPEWLCRWKFLGSDPLTGLPVYPVHTPQGRLAGVCVREGGERKYRYPSHWSASQSLWGSAGVYVVTPVVMVVEGAADAAAGWELGVPSFATYGAGLHAPQYQLLRRMSPQVVIVGFDADEAGDKAATMAWEELETFAAPVRAVWPDKDPAESDPAVRWGAIESVVPHVYGRFTTWRAECEKVAHDAATRYGKAA